MNDEYSRFTFAGLLIGAASSATTLGWCLLIAGLALFGCMVWKVEARAQREKSAHHPSTGNGP